MKVVSIFQSLNGEVCGDGKGGNGQGQLTVFVRFAFCPVGCEYCDTKYTWGENSDWLGEMTEDEIYQAVEKYGIKNVTITGGEPGVWMTKLVPLLERFLLGGYNISIYTSGVHNLYPLRLEKYREQVVKNTIISVAHGDTPYPVETEIILKPFENKITWVLDYKPKSCNSKMRTDLKNISLLKPNDWFKCVIASKEDFKEFYEVITEYKPKCHIAISPCWPYDNSFPSEIANTIIENGLEDITLYLQLHRIVWPVLSASNNAKEEI